MTKNWFEKMACPNFFDIVNLTVTKETQVRFFVDSPRSLKIGDLTTSHCLLLRARPELSL